MKLELKSLYEVFGFVNDCGFDSKFDVDKSNNVEGKWK